MKIRILWIYGILCLMLWGCAPKPNAQIVATTATVYDFTTQICSGTDLTVAQLITENVSCLHDYTLKTEQIKAVESSECIVISGAGLESFLDDILDSEKLVDASAGIPLLEGDDDHEEDHTDHHHDEDPHIWLSPKNAVKMAKNICAGLSERFPQYQDVFADNLCALVSNLEALDTYGQEALSRLSTRDLITFHDGFAYLAESYHLELLASIEEESGSEASAKDLIALITLVRGSQLPAVFTEKNGSPSAASIISRETGCSVYPLDMAMTGRYLDAMYHNFNAIKEALE